MPAPISPGFIPPEPDLITRMIVQSVTAFASVLAALGVVVAVLAMCIARGA